jgi:hypothetical protein
MVTREVVNMLSLLKLRLQAKTCQPRWRRAAGYVVLNRFITLDRLTD